MTRTTTLLALLVLAACGGSPTAEAPPDHQMAAETPPPSETPAQEEDRMPQTDAEWRAKLTPMQYRVLRQDGTEPAGTGEYLHHDEDGVYRCAGCGNALYESTAKFDHHAWPAFDQAIPGSVGTKDVGFGTKEVHCAKCKGHLGHIFTDGPRTTGLRH